MTTTMPQQRTAWWRSPDDPNGPPTGVSNATTILFTVIGLALAYNLYRLTAVVAIVADPNAELDGYAATVLFLSIAVQIAYLSLAWKVRKGSRAAWIALLVLASVHIVGVLAAIVSLNESGGPALLVVPVLLLAVVLLTAPRSSRRYFKTR